MWRSSKISSHQPPCPVLHEKWNPARSHVRLPGSLTMPRALLTSRGEEVFLQRTQPPRQASDDSDSGGFLQSDRGGKVNGLNGSNMTCCGYIHRSMVETHMTSCFDLLGDDVGSTKEMVRLDVPWISDPPCAFQKSRGRNS